MPSGTAVLEQMSSALLSAPKTTLKTSFFPRHFGEAILEGDIVGQQLLTPKRHCIASRDDSLSQISS
jgi:hypothetical protein